MNASAVPALGDATDDAVIQQALRVLEGRMRSNGPLLTNPQSVHTYLRLRIADLWS